MPVYGLDELAVPLKEYPTVLAPGMFSLCKNQVSNSQPRTGALVEVTFRLMHCAFPDRETKQYTNDIFSARAVTVNILKAARSAPRVPFIPRRPVPKPQQSPVKRGVNPSASERQNAAKCFCSHNGWL